MITQLTLPDTRSMKALTPEQLMTAALHWIDANSDGWSHIVARCRSDVRFYGQARVKAAIEDVRLRRVVRPDGSPVKLPNAYSAAFGRILVSWYPQDFAEAVPLTHSKLDGCVIPEPPLWAKGL